ncbi:hypothetical protein RIF29_13862 [Crotalaria pallida]|uniref:Uncharacterized protein n=1 Tax=Crotalaria pallida TaxID=3830 RepID=A0AAN9FAD3_CROPI
MLLMLASDTFLQLQNLISVTIVSILSLLGLISTEPLTWRLTKVWLPVNVIFVGMLITSMFRMEANTSVDFLAKQRSEMEGTWICWE